MRIARPCAECKLLLTRRLGEDEGKTLEDNYILTRVGPGDRNGSPCVSGDERCADVHNGC